MDYPIARKRMVRDQLMARGIKDEKILQTMLKIPRHLFVEEGLHPMAYNDHPLSIGAGQTISQPFIVAYMIERLQLGTGHRVLEVGTGCGYMTTVLAELAHWVYSIERIDKLLFGARKTLKKLGYKNVTLKLGDGTAGWPSQAPFDAIVVSAGGPKIPQPYLDQLAPGGRLILPVGGETSQQLTLVTKRGSGYSEEVLTDCRFVKLKGKYGFQPT